MHPLSRAVELARVHAQHLAHEWSSKEQCLLTTHMIDTLISGCRAKRCWPIDERRHDCTETSVTVEARVTSQSSKPTLGWCSGSGGCCWRPPWLVSR